MKTRFSLSLSYALFIAVATVGAPQIARAQQQPRPAPRTISADTKITLPAQFSAPQFFDALADATNARIVAPVPDDAQLAQLRARMGGKTLTPPEIWPLYEQTLGYRFANSHFDGEFITVRLPDEMIYPTKTISENKAAFLRLLVAFSPEQINRMYLQGGLTVEDLTPEQTRLYLEALRKSADVYYVTGSNKPLSDEQMLAQPVRFSFSFEAVALFTDDESLPSLPIFDYSTGLIWNPLVGANTNAFAKDAYARDVAARTPIGTTLTASISSEKARATTLDYAQTQATTVGAALDAIAAKLGQTIVLDSEFYAPRARATPIVISAGRFRADELLDAIASCIGAQSVFRNDAPTLEKRAPQQPISQLPPLVAEAQNKLQRLSLRSAGLPFLPSRFERRQTLYSELTGSEELYLRAKLLNENTDGYDQIDLSKHTFRFVNRISFTGQTGSIDAPFITSTMQIW